MIKSSLALTVTALFLIGCQTHNPIPKDFYSDTPENRFPPVSVFSMKPSNELTSLCERALCQENGLQVGNLYRELEKSEMFYQIANENISDYEIKFTARVVNQNRTASGAKMVASAATLFVVPVQVPLEHHSEFRVSWRGIELANYQFTIPYENTITLFIDPKQADRFAAESATSKFIASAQRDGIFTSKFLYAKLQADDYYNELHIPTRVAEYEHISTFVYPDPFLGAQLRFQHSGKTSEKIDVYVYPISQVEWKNLDETLGNEMESVKKEIDLMTKRGDYKSASFGQTQPISFSRSNDTYVGKLAYGDILMDERNSSLIYLFAKKDKFIKVRMTRPDAEGKLTPQEAEKFVQELVSEISVPGESFFIGSLRQNKRNAVFR